MSLFYCAFLLVTFRPTAADLCLLGVQAGSLRLRLRLVWFYICLCKSATAFLLLSATLTLPELLAQHDK
jgi:hypothetical protein